jgi:hypothetical protein
MTSDISVSTTAYQVEKRGWLWGQHGTGPGDNPSVTLDVSTFTAGTHYPNGYIPSGTVLGKITATGKYGPYDSGAADGRQTAAGLLFSSVKVPASTSTPVGGALFVHGFVDPARLPFQSGTGFASAAAKTALNLIYWA